MGIFPTTIGNFEMPASRARFRALQGKRRVQVRTLTALLIAALASSNSPALAQPAAPRLSLTDEAAAFRAAGFKKVGRQWQGCGDPGSASYTPGAIETVRDIDGDGRPEAVITEGSIACFGQSEVGYSLVSKQPNGSWKLITGGEGIARFLPRRAATGWPDIEVGGPGFCFPVQRWNGREYALNRYQYQGKPCRPSR
jgi:hypothetical protein